MKIIHCADLHLDSKMTANLDRARAKERKVEILNTFSRMVDYAATNSVEAILIAGDMFDTNNISALARNTVRDAIISNPGIDFYYLKGNHDRDNFLSSLDELPDNLRLFSDSWTSYNLEDHIVLSAIELTAANSGSYINSLVLDPGMLNIVMLHGQEAESTVKDKAEIINLKELKNKNIDYLALGHIHSYKEAPIDGRGVYCYPGCLEGRGFDELGTHGFVLLDVDGDSHRMDRKFIQFADRQLRQLDVDITDISTTSQIIERIDRMMESYPVGSRNLLKIVLTGNVDIECEKDTDYILKHYEPLFYFVKIDDESKLKINIDDYKYDGSLKGEFVRTVMASTDKGLTDAEKASIIRVGLQAIAGEEID